MPPEYENFWSIVLCNDCEQKSRTKYHFLYHKCQSCHSYNTKILQTLQDQTTADGLVGVPVVVPPTPSGEGPDGPRMRSASSESSMMPDDNELRRR